MGIAQVLAYVTFRRGRTFFGCALTSKAPCFFIVGVQDVIGFADKHVYYLKREVDGQIVYHKHGLLAVQARLKADVRVSSVDNAITATWEALGNEEPGPFICCVIVSVLPSVGEGNCDWDKRDMEGLSTGRESVMWYWIGPEAWSCMPVFWP